MIDQQHLDKLEQAYLADNHRPDQVEDVVVSAGTARITLTVGPADRSAKGILERSFAFEVLNDVAELAAASLAHDGVLQLDQAKLTAPDLADATHVTARAQVTMYREEQIIVTALLFDERGRPLAKSRSRFYLRPEAPTSAPEPIDGFTEDLGYSPITQVVWKTPFGLIFPN